MTRIVTGRHHKQIADEFWVSEQTVKVHRYRVMHKMQAESLVALVRMADQLDLPHTPLSST